MMTDGTTKQEFYDETDNGTVPPEGREREKRKEIYSYTAPWTTYAMAWCRRPDDNGRFKIAVGSYIEEYTNQFQIIQLQPHPKPPSEEDKDLTKPESEYNSSFKKVGQFDHPYPATKVMWAPAQSKLSAKDLLATTGDYLRLWGVDAENNVEMLGVLNNNKHAEYCAPLTSFDWNEADPTIIGSCSIDTTCTIWDVAAMSPKTQLIAHDKEVYDLAFASSKDIFGTVGGDGSLRLFDLRALEHSTILYESPYLTPLLRIIWNKEDSNYIATIHTESNKAIILDIRVPNIPLAELYGHNAVINGIAWAPHSSNHICTCGDDRQALIWDVNAASSLGNANPNLTPNTSGNSNPISSKSVATIEDPILAFNAAGEINNLQWCKSHEAKLAGECASLCNDLRTEVLTLEMCREARKTLPRPKVGDFCLKAMEQGFSDSCVSLCMNERPISRVAQSCRAAAIEMPRPTVRRWCEHGYNVAFQKTVQDLRDHFRLVVEAETAQEAAETPLLEEDPNLSAASERSLQEDAPVAAAAAAASDSTESTTDAASPSAAVLATISVSLEDGVARDLVVLQGQNAEEAVVIFCREHMASDLSSCIRQLLPVVLEKLDEVAASA